MKFGQLIKYSAINIFFIHHAENDTRRLVPDLFCFLKSFIQDKSKWSAP